MPAFLFSHSGYHPHSRDATLNPYQYTAENPLRFIDPNGEEYEEPEIPTWLDKMGRFFLKMLGQEEALIGLEYSEKYAPIVAEGNISQEDAEQVEEEGFEIANDMLVNGSMKTIDDAVKTDSGKWWKFWEQDAE